MRRALLPVADASLPCAVLAGAAALRLWTGTSLRFDGLYGQDPFAYYHHGVALWRDHSAAYRWPWLPAPSRLFWPYGEPVLLAAAFALAGTASTAAAQATSILAGCLAVAFLYPLALRVAGCCFAGTVARLCAALAAALLATGGLAVQAGVTIMADAPALCWGLAALWLWARPYKNDAGQCANALGAGICVSLACSTRYEYALLIPAMALYWWLQVPGRRPGLVHALAGTLPVTLAQTLLSLGRGAPVLHHPWLTGWRIAHAWQRTFITADGVQHHQLSAGTFYLLRPLLSWQSLPFTLAPFLPMGILALARRAWSDSDARALFTMMAAWWLAPALFLAGVPFESARFTLIYLPPLALLEAIGLAAAIHHAEHRRARRRGRARVHISHPIRAAGGVWAILSLGILAAHARDGTEALARGAAADRAAICWLVLHAPPRAGIATFGLTLALSHYGDPAAHRWHLLDLSAAGVDDLDRFARGDRLYIVVDRRNLAAQWRGLPPERAFSRLYARTRPSTLATIGAYTVLAR